MKKVQLYIIPAVLAAVLTVTPGCKERNGGSSAAVRQNEPQTRDFDGEITVRLLTDVTGIDDKSFNAAAWNGILEFYGDSRTDTKKRGTLYDVVTAHTGDMIVPALLQATDEGYDLIAVTGSVWADPLAEVAADNPRQKYLIVDVDWLEVVPNVMQAAYAEHEGSYLVGVAAALKAREDNIANPRFGFIGGIPGTVITKFEVGFVQGVLSLIPNARIVDYYINSWGEPSLAKIQAKDWYDSGVYAVYSAAGGSGNGTIAQAREYRAAGRNVWAIGVDSDQHDEGLYNAAESAVLTSMLKRVDFSLAHALEAVKKETFKGEIIVFDLVKGGVDYTASNNALGNDIIAYLESVKQRIMDGRIVVAATHEEAKKIPGFPQNLKAVDD